MLHVHTFDNNQQNKNKHSKPGNGDLANESSSCFMLVYFESTWSEHQKDNFVIKYQCKLSIITFWESGCQGEIH